MQRPQQPTTERIDRSDCFVCGRASSDVLERHHIVPRRHGGSNDAENLVDLCPTCHRKIEGLYNKRFYTKIADSLMSNIELTGDLEPLAVASAISSQIFDHDTDSLAAEKSEEYGHRSKESAISSSLHSYKRIVVETVAECLETSTCDGCWVIPRPDHLEMADEKHGLTGEEKRTTCPYCGSEGNWR